MTTTNFLSQEEIQALLGKRKTNEIDKKNNPLTSHELGLLSELFDIVGAQFTRELTLLTSKEVTATTPKLQVIENNNIFQNKETPFYVALGELTGQIKGLHFITLTKDDCDIYKELLKQSDTTIDFGNELKMFQEIISPLCDTISQSISSILDKEVAYVITGIDIVQDLNEISVNKFIDDVSFLRVELPFSIEQLSNTCFEVFIPIKVAKQCLDEISEYLGEVNVEEENQMSFQSNSQTNEKDTKLEDTPKIQTVQFSNFEESAPISKEPNNLNLLLDIPLQVTVELGRTKRTVKEILEISHGSIIELDKLAGEPVDILVNNKLIAVGEVVVIDENFGVRVTDILSTEERISKLR